MSSQPSHASQATLPPSAGLPRPQHGLRRRLGAVLAAGALALSMVATGLGVQVAAAPAAQASCTTSSFTDVSTSDSAYAAVTWMACNGITSGYSDGSFGVDQPVTRGEVAAFLHRQTTPAHPSSSAPYFTDVPASGRFYSTPVAWMAQAGYAHRDALTFRPNDPVTRGELAAYIYRVSGATQTGPSTSPYRDMGWSTPFYHAATWLKSQAIAGGYSDGTFRPTRNITRGETAIMLTNARTQLSGKGDVTTPVLSPLKITVEDSSGSTVTWKEKAADWAVAKATSSSTYYTYGGNGPNGFDCSGFIIGAFGAGGKTGLPRRANDQYRAADSYVPLSEIKVGDLVYWSNGSSVYHIAIYVGNGKIAHARNPEMGVTLTDLKYSPWNMLSVAGRYN